MRYRFNFFLAMVNAAVVSGLIHRRRLLLQKHPVAPVAESFAGVPLLRETRKDGAEFDLEVGLFQHVLEQFVEPGAGGIAAEPELVTPRRLAHESDLRGV